MTGAVLHFVAYPPPLALFTDGLSQNILKIKQKKEPLNSNLQKKSCCNTQLIILPIVVAINQFLQVVVS